MCLQKSSVQLFFNCGMLLDFSNYSAYQQEIELDSMYITSQRI
jgi:hypothetical protein